MHRMSHHAHKLSEVFLLVARGHDVDKQELASSSIRPSSAALAAEDADKSSRSRMDLQKEGLLGTHISALFKKRAAFFRRDKKAWICTTILPSVFVLWGFLLFKFVSPTRDLDELTLNFDKYNPDIDGVRQPIVFNDPAEPFICQPGSCAYQSPIIDSSTTTGEFYGFCGVKGMLQDSSTCSLSRTGDIASQLADIAGVEAVPVSVSNVTEASTSLTETKKIYGASQYGAILFSHELDSVITESSVPYATAVVEQCQSIESNFTTAEDCERLAGVGYLIQYNFTALHASPLYQALADEALVKQYRAEQGLTEDFTVEASLHPLPITDIEEGFGNAEDATAAWFLVMLSFPFIGGAFASFVVVERESKAKHLQTVAGVEPIAYWISTFLWDTMNYQVPLWITVGLMYAFDISVLTTTARNVASGVIAILFFYGPAAAGYSYVVSFAFTSPALCNMFVIVTGFLIGLGGPLTNFILLIIAKDPGNPKPKLEDIANIITWCLRIFFPTFNLGKGLLYVSFPSGKSLCDITTADTTLHIFCRPSTLKL
jgi:hypothetical protein